MPAAPQTNNFEKRDPIKPGTYQARCYSVVIMGTFKETYNGEEKEVQKVRITWELPTEMITYTKKYENGTEEKVTAPSVIGSQYTFSMGKNANLRKMVESMITPLSDGEAKAFDVFDLVGMECLLSVANIQKKDGNGSYAVVQAVMPVPRGVQVPPMVNTPVKFYFAEWDQDVFDALPKFVKEKINSSIERTTVTPEQESLVDEPPF